MVEYVDLDKFKKDNSRSRVKARKFGSKIKSFGKSFGSKVGEGAKKTYGAATSEKAVKGYKKAGKLAGQGFKYVRDMDKPKKVTRKRVNNRQKIVYVQEPRYVQERIVYRNKKKKTKKKKSDDLIDLGW